MCSCLLPSQRWAAVCVWVCVLVTTHCPLPETGTHRVVCVSLCVLGVMQWLGMHSHVQMDNVAERLEAGETASLALSNIQKYTSNSCKSHWITVSEEWKYQPWPIHLWFESSREPLLYFYLSRFLLYLHLFWKFILELPCTKTRFWWGWRPKSDEDWICIHWLYLATCAKAKAVLKYLVNG